jgi:hypothetical protein
VQSWALEAPPEGRALELPPAEVELPAQTRGKVAELLELGETLFEETVADARRKLGSYPEADEAAHVGANIFKGLRALLGMSAPGPTGAANEREPGVR